IALPSLFSLLIGFTLGAICWKVRNIKLTWLATINICITNEVIPLYAQYTTLAFCVESLQLCPV
uniref:Uncharacterized protein n=1 Tax=Terrapene triunguis TaxID=2587831 RepID=A0A674I260_9SAUR